MSERADDASNVREVRRRPRTRPLGTQRRARASSTAFVLSGGASLGAIQVGMLLALYQRGVRPDVIVGTPVDVITGEELVLSAGSRARRHHGQRRGPWRAPTRDR